MRKSIKRDARHAASPAAATEDHGVFVGALAEAGVPLAFYGCDRSLLHATPAFQRVLATGGDGDGARVKRELEHFVAGLCALAELRMLRPGAAPETLSTRELSLPSGRHRLRGTYLGMNPFGAARSVVVVVLEPPPPDPLGESVLRERFALSLQQARIARLLAHGRSNAEIAAEMGLSSHTTRHHTEIVLQKLRLNSRAGVGAVFAGRTVESNNRRR